MYNTILYQEFVKSLEELFSGNLKNREIHLNFHAVEKGLRLN